jgi:hypothetical protein
MTMKIPLLWIGALGAALLAAGALAKESGTTRVDVELMAAPYRDAKPSGKLGANTRVDVLERRGAWMQVSAADRDGWLRLHQVRLGDGSAQKGSSGIAALWNVGTTGRSGSQGIVATTGIRGMSAEQLKDAKPNAKEVEKLEHYRATDQQARQLAGAAGLKAKDVAALPKPE